MVSLENKKRYNTFLSLPPAEIKTTNCITSKALPGMILITFGMENKWIRCRCLRGIKLGVVTRPEVVYGIPVWAGRLRGPAAVAVGLEAAQDDDEGDKRAWNSRRHRARVNAPLLSRSRLF